MTQPPPSGYPDPNLPPQQAPGYQPPAQQPGYGAPPPAGQVPPPGYQPPPPGYQAPPPAAPPPGYANSEEKTWALVSTFGAAAGSLISGGVLTCVGPLIAYLVKGKESATVKAHSVAALNIFIPISAASLLLFIFRVCNGIIFDYGVLYTLISFVLGLAQLALWAVGIIFGVLAGMKANEGQLYKYPFSANIIK